jgi:exosortase/archaeosortase family protein
MATLATGAVPAAFARPGRNGLFFWLVLIASLNAFAGVAFRIVPEHGLVYALFELFGISAILWVALAAALALLRGAEAVDPVSRADWAVAAAVVGAALLPDAPASAAALTLLALWMIAWSPAGSAARRAGIVALALSMSLLWGRVFLALFSRPLLGTDSWLVGQLLGVRAVGNSLPFADGSGGLAVAPGCSSWQGMSLALVFWVTVNQWFEVRFGWKPLGWCLLALAATIAVNVVRIGAMVHFPAHLAEIHHGYGWHLAMWTSLVLVCAICLYGARREIFR